MANEHLPRIILDPNDVVQTLQQFAELYQIPIDTLEILGRIVAVYPRAARMYINDADLAALLPTHHDQIMDLFTFDMETDELICYSRDQNTLIDALIEMAMYQAGFSTMMGNDDAWVIEFTIGAWKHVKKRIKNQLDIPVEDRPTGVVGLPPDNDEETHLDEDYPFQMLVSHFTLNAFYQMVVLAARDNLAVYFPPNTHHKVMASYVYSRRAMEDIAQGIDLSDPATFNMRLIRAIRRMDALFKPATLSPSTRPIASRLNEQPIEQEKATPSPINDLPPNSPFTDFIEELFADDDSDTP